MRGLIRSIVAAAAAAVTLLAPAAGQGAGAPALAWSPTNGAYDYGTVTVGQTASQTFTLTNSGGSATGILTVTLSGSSAFTKTADGCTATSLGPRKSCSVSVQYGPTTPGQSDSATLTASGKKPAASAGLTLTGASTPRHVYWVNNSDGGSATIGRADVDGSNPNQSFITGASFPEGVAVDSGHVYWANFFTSTIGRADLYGQNPNQSFITGAAGPVGVAVDSGHVYWANF